MKIHLVFLTYNRLDYTKLALPALLADANEEFALTIWDNGSTDGTVEYLKTLRDKRIVEIVFSDKNYGQAYVTDKIWSATNADLVGKVDNDCLVTAGWTRILAKAHKDLPQLGVIGCWHFFPDEFEYERAKNKIQEFGNHRIFRHPWVDGSALLVKRKTYMEFRPCRDKEYLTRFWIRLALAGYINGFYYPLIYQEHMDDVRSEHNRLRKMSFREAYKYIPSYQEGTIRDLKTYNKNRQENLENVLEGTFDPKFYSGWGARFRWYFGKMKEIPNRLTQYTCIGEHLE